MDPLADFVGTSARLIQTPIDSKDGVLSPGFVEYTELQPMQISQVVAEPIKVESKTIKPKAEPVTVKKETPKTEEELKKIKKERLKMKRKKRKEAKKAAAAKKNRKPLKCTCKKTPQTPKQIPWKDNPPTAANANTKILFRCGMCTFQTLNKEDIINHAEIHKNEVTPKQPVITKPSPCKKCALKKKKALILDNKCPHCDFCTSNKRSLKIHMHIHANKNYKCINCGYAATDVKELIRHQQIHIDEKKCKTCKSVFYYREKPRKNKQLLCKTCYYPATSKTDLNLHMKSHKDIKPCMLPVPNTDYDTIVE